MILTAKCVGCGHIINVRPDCPTNFSCPVCGLTYFTFNHDIKIKNNIHEHTIPQGGELNAKDGSLVWTITQVIEPSPPHIITEATPKVIPDSAPKEIKEEKKKEPDFPKPSPLKSKIERYKIKRKTARKSGK